MYIEPCCAARQLPQELKNSKGICFFQTSGDVLLEKLLDATASLAGDSHTMLLAVPEADIALCRTLALYLRRQWTRAVLLITQQNQQELIASELSAYVERVHYAADPLILDGLCALFGDKALIIQGAILSRPDFSLCQYAAYLGTNRDTIRQATDPLVSKLRMKALIDHSSNEDIARMLNRQFF